MIIKFYQIYSTIKIENSQYFLFVYLGLSKVNINFALPLTKIYLIIVIEKATLFGSNRIASGGENGGFPC